MRSTLLVGLAVVVSNGIIIVPTTKQVSLVLVLLRSQVQLRTWIYGNGELCLAPSPLGLVWSTVTASLGLGLRLRRAI